MIPACQPLAQLRDGGYRSACACGWAGHTYPIHTPYGPRPVEARTIALLMAAVHERKAA